LMTTGVAGAVPAFASSSSPVRVTATTTERETNPIGIDAAKPRLGWRLDSSTRGQSQTAYEVAVGTKARAADVRDSGRVASPQSVDVSYGGPALRSGHRYYWRVRVWDAQGRPSDWSRTSFFETGPAQQDWTAKWVGSPDTTPSLTGADWIWYPEGDPT